jgi:hypothetical protein
VGGELKAGVYGNHASANNVITVTDTMGTFGQFGDGLVRNDVAFIGEANLQGLYRISQNWTVKLGYTLLYADGVALASSNFNTAPPQVLFPGALTTRTPFLDNNSSVFYHGFTAGMEFLW